MRTDTFKFISAVTHAAEWERAWLALTVHWQGDTADYNDQYGECWQYMGTELRADTWEHVFRHRMHPRTQRREYWRTPASDRFHRENPIPTPPARQPYETDVPSLTLAHLNGAFDGVSVTSDADPGL